MPSIFMRDKSILSSERMLRMEYDRKDWVTKINALVISQKELGSKMN
jgi:hypothetical protein